MTDSPVRAQRKSRLAELVSLDITIAAAAERMGIARHYAYTLWKEIRTELGAQAV